MSSSSSSSSRPAGSRAVPFCTNGNRSEGAQEESSLYTNPPHVEIFLTTAASQILSMWLILDHIEYAYHGKAELWLVFEESHVATSDMVRDIAEAINSINGISRMGYRTKIHMRLSRALVERIGQPSLELRDNYTNERIGVFKPCEEHTAPGFAIFFVVPNGILSIMISTLRGEEIKAFYAHTISYISRAVFDDQRLVYLGENIFALAYVAKFMGAFQSCFWVDFTPGSSHDAQRLHDMLISELLLPPLANASKMAKSIFEGKGEDMKALYKRILAENASLQGHATTAGQVHANNPEIRMRSKMLYMRCFNGGPLGLPSSSLILAGVFMMHLKNPLLLDTLASPRPVSFTPTGLERDDQHSRIYILHEMYFPMGFREELANEFWHLLGVAP